MAEPAQPPAAASNGDEPDESPRLGGFEIRVSYVDERPDRIVRARAIHLLDFEEQVGEIGEHIGSVRGVATLAHLADEDERPLRDWLADGIDSLALVETRPTLPTVDTSASPVSPSLSGSAPTTSPDSIPA